MAVDKSRERGESLDQRNRRVMLNHVENFWVKGVLEKSLHGVALLELRIKEDPSVVNYPWTMKREPTNETLPAGKSMLEIFQEIGLGRSLLILGAPGSGKTTMLIDLTRELVECARQDETEPIPVVFNLASWTEKKTLADWLAEQLNIIYYVPRKIAPMWVKENRMLLLLDGLDEVIEGSREKCVEAINRFRNEQGLTSLVICSRIEEYRVIQTKLSLEGAIALQPLTSKQVETYVDRFGNNLANLRLLLKADEALQELAETPLVLSFMALAYKDMRVNELASLGNIENQRNRLFNTYIETMFERPTRHASLQFTKEETSQYLKWLARRMIQHNMITFQIESMQPFWLREQSQRLQYRFYVALIHGMSFGLVSLLLIALLFGDLRGGLGFGILMTLISGLAVMLIPKILGLPIEKIVMIDRLKWSWSATSSALRRHWVFAFIVGLILALVQGLYRWPGYMLVFLLSSIFLVGFTSEGIEESTYPGQRVGQTLANAALFTLIFGSIIWLISGLFAGIMTGTLIVLSLALYRLHPIITHFSLRWVIAKSNLLPRQLLPFLDSCVSLIFLRRVGGSYIFVHRLLMEHFAEMDV